MDHLARCHSMPRPAARVVFTAVALHAVAIGCAHDAKSSRPSEPTRSVGQQESASISGEAWRNFSAQLRADGERILEGDFPSAPEARAEGAKQRTGLS